MTRQRLLLRFMSSRLLGRAGRRFVQRRPWTIESGVGAGLKLTYPQNLEFISGTSELPVQRALAGRVRPGDVVYDIGANVGFFTIIAAKLVGATGAVCAFEPVAENATTIRQNARLNQLDHVQLFEVAVGKDSGTAELLLTDWDGGSTLSSSSVKPTEPVSRRTVPVVALDAFMASGNLPPPDFIKIDVEGVELEVLQGMSATLARGKAALLYEIDDGNRAAFERRWQEVDDYVARFGYTIQRLESSYTNEHWCVGHSLAIPRTQRRAT